MPDEDKEQAPDVEIEPVEEDEEDETENVEICPECGMELEECICEEV